MSIRIMSQVWDNGPEDKAELVVMLALADFADDEGKCWPSVDAIGKKARMSERNARRILRKLEVDGYLKTIEGGGRHGCSQYRINPDKMSPGQNVPPGQNEQETRTKRARNPDIAMSAEPSRTIKEPSKSKARATLCEILRPETADAFISHRKAKRAMLTDHAAVLIAKKLAGCSDPDAVVNDSIANGWTGVFPEKSKPPPRPTTDLDAAFAQFGLPPMRTTQ